MTNSQQLHSTLRSYCTILRDDGFAKMGFGLIVAGLLAGCAMPNGYYQPATVKDGTISNPRVGWNGYSVKVPDGFAVFNPTTADPDSPDLTAFQRFYMQDEDRLSRALGISYTEWFLLEHRLLDCAISFSCNTYDLRASWSSMTSVSMEYFLRKLVNAKLVNLNDVDAHNELVTINGHRGCYISATTLPPYGGDQKMAYEGFFILGGLKEAYWFEGFGALYNRSMLKRLTRGMAESLEVK
ncbi:MAG: hypothetical protein K9M54_08070 [Kiritimatiellales bacterium]|nr:hypothetical protein [Kiritimatiellales bacterium]